MLIPAMKTLYMFFLISPLKMLYILQVFRGGVWGGVFLMPVVLQCPGFPVKKNTTDMLTHNLTPKQKETLGFQKFRSVLLILFLGYEAW